MSQNPKPWNRLQKYMQLQMRTRFLCLAAFMLHNEYNRLPTARRSDMS